MFVDHRMVEMRCAGRFCFVFFLFSLQNASSHLFPFHLDLCCCFKAISLVGVKPAQALSILDFLFFARCLEKFSVTSQTNLTDYKETESVNEMLGCDHSNETSLAVLSHCVVFQHFAKWNVKILCGASFESERGKIKQMTLYGSEAVVLVWMWNSTGYVDLATVV